MLEKRIDSALTDEELDKVGGGIAENDLKRLKCPSCENIFMANTNVTPTICPDCSYVFEKEDIDATSKKSGGVTVARRGKKKKNNGILVSGGGGFSLNGRV
ncbi:MAG: hypothetical protein IKP31_05005 [Lachnospiraceae bacterium]|nr:hypothetical protein [Lachnospiraceae bacterium]